MSKGRSTLMTDEQSSLPLADEAITVHCFFGCPYVAQSADPQEAHDLRKQQ
jgi:hypothetical protein